MKMTPIAFTFSEDNPPVIIARTTVSSKDITVKTSLLDLFDIISRDIEGYGYTLDLAVADLSMKYLHILEEISLSLMDA